MAQIPDEVAEGLQAKLAEQRVLRKENPHKRVIGGRRHWGRRVIFEMSHEGKAYSYHATKGWRIGRA